MPDNIYEKLLASYELLQGIVKVISETKFIRHDEGILSVAGYFNPQEMKTDILQDIDAFFDLADELSFFFADDELAGIKNVAFKKLKRIQFVFKLEYRASNFQEYIPAYKALRSTQKSLKDHFVKLLTEDSDLNIKSEKFLWEGNQRQLVELFELLIKHGWINADFKNSHLPIVEMFNIKLNGQIKSLNVDSFRVAWKPDSSNTATRNPGDYEKIFKTLPDRKPKSSK